MVTRRLSATSGSTDLHRETIAAGESDTFWQRSSDLLHWIWSWRLQIQRLRESTNHDGEGSTPVEKRKSFSRASLDEHLLAVVGGHLVKSINNFDEHLPTEKLLPEDSEALRLLRNLYEHWDEQRAVFEDPTAIPKRSGKEFSELFPQGRPYSITYGQDDWFLAGIVPLNRVTHAALSIADAVLALEEREREKDRANGRTPQRENR